MAGGGGGGVGSQPHQGFPGANSVMQAAQYLGLRDGMAWIGGPWGGEGTDDSRGDLQGWRTRAFPPAWQSEDSEPEMNGFKENKSCLCAQSLCRLQNEHEMLLLSSLWMRRAACIPGPVPVGPALPTDDLTPGARSRLEGLWVS